MYLTTICHAEFAVPSKAEGYFSIYFTLELAPNELGQSSYRSCPETSSG